MAQESDLLTGRPIRIRRQDASLLCKRAKLSHMNTARAKGAKHCFFSLVATQKAQVSDNRCIHAVLDHI